MAGTAVSIETRRVGGRAVLVLSGQLDFRAHRAFKAAYEPALASTGVDEVQVDLAAIEQLDTTALALLLILRERGLAANKRVSLINGHGSVSDMLARARFGKLFTIL